MMDNHFNYLSLAFEEALLANKQRKMLKEWCIRRGIINNNWDEKDDKHE